jgi:hypothetical protein
MCIKSASHVQVLQLLALAAGQRRELLLAEEPLTPGARGRCVWSSDAEGLEEAAASQEAQGSRDRGMHEAPETEVQQKLAEALASSKGDHPQHLVCIQIKFAHHEESSFGVLLHRPPQEVSAMHFTDKHCSGFKGEALFIYKGELEVDLWTTHCQAIEEHTAKWGFSASHDRTGDWRLEEACHLVRLKDGQVSLEDMGGPFVVEGRAITMQTDSVATPCSLEEPSEESEEDIKEAEESLAYEEMLKNLAPFCRCLSLRFMLSGDLFQLNSCMKWHAAATRRLSHALAHTLTAEM